MSEEYRELKVTEIEASPLNPRKEFDGEGYEEFKQSVKEKGIVQPVLVRPKPKGKGYELVAGERRHRAVCDLAEGNGDVKAATIPAIIRDLDDDAALEIMLIENLQRKNLTPLEEAEGFKSYIDKKGKGGLRALSEKTGVDQRYIRRRIAILELPKTILKQWDKGNLRHGHLKELLKVPDKKERNELAKWAADFKGALPVRELAEHVQENAIDLAGALFDVEKVCVNSGCNHRSDYQIETMGLKGTPSNHCLHKKCFKQKQNNWLLSNWKSTPYRKGHKTNGFRFNEDVEYFQWERIDRRHKACKDCKDFVTLLGLDGDVRYGKVCIGDEECYNKYYKWGEPKEDKKKKEAGEKKTENRAPGEPRVSWHGEHFREAFYQEILPGRLQDVPADDVKAARMALFSLVISNHDVLDWFSEWGENEDILHEETPYYSRYLEYTEAWEKILYMDRTTTLEALKQASARVVMQGQTGEASRSAIAAHIGVSLEKDWRITAEYLEKKTKAKIIEIGEQFKIFRDEKVKEYCASELLKEPGKYKNFKKPELVKVFLESGVNLAGVVPVEILNVKRPAGPELVNVLAGEDFDGPDLASLGDPGEAAEASIEA